MSQTDIQSTGAIAHSPSANPPNDFSWLISEKNAAPLTNTKVCVIGGGFVGLVTAVCMAQSGHTVTCVEKDKCKVAALQKGETSLYERNLPELLRANLERDRLTFTSDLADVESGQDVFVVSVGTPADANGQADLTALRCVFETLAGCLTGDQVVVIKSTVPVGTAAWARSILNNSNGHRRSVNVVSSPEFLREGTAVFDYFHPQRIVVGGESGQAVDRVVQLYRAGLATPAPIVLTSNETAEMIKYASNVYLAMRVAYVNELSGVCDAFGIDISDVSSAMGLDPRIGSEYLDAGPGFGGSCLPKDLSAFISDARERGADLAIAPAVQKANEIQFQRVISKARMLLENTLAGRRIGVLGLAFKAHTHDLRDSPAVRIVTELLKVGAEVRAYDPAAMTEAKTVLPSITLCDKAEDVAQEADLLMVLTEWPQFQLLDWAHIHGAMRTPAIVDARNLLMPETMKRLGFAYIGMGQQ